MKKLALILIGACVLEASALLEPATLINDNMVLQRNRSVPVWGKADPGAQIKVAFGQTTVTAKADAAGTWRADLPAMKACAQARTLTIASSSGETVACTNVVVGEVWLCGGQSNMTFAMWPAPRVGKNSGRERNGYYDIMLTDEPDVRGVAIPLLWSAEPQNLKRQSWFTFTEGKGGTFSAAAYHYALRLHQALKIPVGVIVSAWGGTRIEPWIPACGYEKSASQKELATKPIRTEPTESEKKWAAKYKRKPGLHQQPRALYNAMIHPLAPYALRGAIWYQGESNRGQWEKYYEQLVALRAGWSEKFETSDMPFYLAQISPYGYTATDESDPGTTQIREEMERFGATEKNCGTAILSDVGELDNIHPGDKRTVGTRLAALALNRTYGRTDILCDAPKFKSVSPVVEGKVTLAFDYVKGWVMNGEQPLRFELAGADGKYVAVKSELTEAGVVLEVPAGMVPEKVAYMRLSRWQGFLKNEAGLPLGPFRAEIPKQQDETAAIQAQIDDCFRKGGGEVRLAKGCHPVKSIRLRSHVTLHLERDAKLVASRCPEDYAGILENDTVEPVGDFLAMGGKEVERVTNRWHRAIIRIFRAHNVSIVGEPGSMIDGRNCYDPLGEEKLRGPHAIVAQFTTNLTLCGYSVRDAGNYGLFTWRSSDVTVSNLTIRGGHDGLDFFWCNRVRVSNCDIESGDDCVAGHSNRDWDVRDCRLNSSCSIFRIGGNGVRIENIEARGPGLYAHRQTFRREALEAGLNPTDHGRRNTLSFFTFFASKTTPDPAGDLVFKNCRISNVDKFIHLNLSGSERWQQGFGLADVRFENVAVDGLVKPGVIYDTKESPLDLTLDNVAFSFREPVDELFLGANVKKVKIRGLGVKGMSGPFLRSWEGVPADDTQNLSGIEFKVEPASGPFKVRSI